MVDVRSHFVDVRQETPIRNLERSEADQLRETVLVDEPVVILCPATLSAPIRGEDDGGGDEPMDR